MNEVKYARNPLMSDFTENYFETKDHVKLRYLHKGEGMPLILLHGYSDDADAWLMNAPAFAEYFSVYCLDQRGHSFSRADHGARISRLAADVHEFIEFLGAPKVNLLGHSMGCSVIWSYIDLFGQDKLNKVIFDDEPVMLVSNPKFSREDVMVTGSNPMDIWQLVNAIADHGSLWYEEDSAFMKAFPACFHRGILWYTEEEMKQIPDGYLEKFSQRPPQPAAMSNQFMADLLKDHLMLDWRDMMHLIKVPTMFISGEVSHATTKEMCDWLMEQILHCELVKFTKEEYGNHDLAQTAHKKFNRVVLEFLQK